MFKKTTLAIIALTIAGSAVVSTSASAGRRDTGSDRAMLEELDRDEARGGPWVEGARAPGMVRYRVCQNLPTTVYDEDLGERVVVVKKQCWWQ
ncbi:hypothetical protein GGD81_003111 [Rhodobium orientis]|uniref:Uncharacterized protein n=1 Tax=Rhodobium orientis TaxID=34017 RepID=A0A327JSW1_9HYPH|nr:hypothetical protein [Rhodobium orientis]MBB4304056.1 hypothetical protein [Rhodobium orientis]MBK5950739.1 hypothetical protein [Rhodobium orientis]RAI29589.1 hypothetical protein CH339_02785 [Rhodobium orientis]